MEGGLGKTQRGWVGGEVGEEGAEDCHICEGIPCGGIGRYYIGVEGRVKEVDNCISMYFVSLCAKKQGVVGMTKIGLNVSL